MFFVDLLKLFQLNHVNKQSAPVKQLNRHQIYLSFITTLAYQKPFKSMKAFINVSHVVNFAFPLQSYYVIAFILYDQRSVKSTVSNLLFLLEKQCRIKAFLLFVKSNKQPTFRINKTQNSSLALYSVKVKINQKVSIQQYQLIDKLLSKSQVDACRTSCGLLTLTVRECENHPEQ